MDGAEDVWKRFEQGQVCEWFAQVRVLWHAVSGLTGPSGLMKIPRTTCPSLKI